MTGAPDDLPSRPSLGALSWLVLRDVNRTVGGGNASMELMRRGLIRRGWLDDAGHAMLVAVSRFTPGTNLLAYCSGLGWFHHGWVGASVAVVAASLPGALVIAVMAAVVGVVNRWAAVRAVLAAATLVAAGLVLTSAWALLRPHLSGTRRWWTVISVAGTLALWFSGATPVRVLLALAVWGALTPAPSLPGEGGA